jgi:hypothetical protein
MQHAVQPRRSTVFDNNNQNGSNDDSGDGNSGHAVEPSKSSGISPPNSPELVVTLDGSPLQPGEVYELTEDYRPPSKSKSKKARLREVLYAKGTRFVVDDDLSVSSVSHGWQRVRGSTLSPRRDGLAGEYGAVVRNLRGAHHDDRSILLAAGVDDEFVVAHDLLGQLWTLGKVSVDDL